MSSTQEKLRRAMMTGPNRWAEATINGKLVSYYEIHDETILLALIDSAKREGAIEELKKLPSNRHESSSYCNAEFFIDSEDRWKRIKELEQSEESE